MKISFRTTTSFRDLDLLLVRWLRKIPKKKHLPQVVVKKNMGAPKWMIYNGKPYENG